MQAFDPSEFTILIVDDFLKNIQVLGTTLRENGYVIEYATNGEKALQLVSKYEFDLVLLDIMMPNIDGYEVCHRIRTEIGNADIPIIFLTAKTDKESLIKGFEVGGQDYITKPFDPSELLARVKTHLELKKSRTLLEEVNANLEIKVDERTKELKEANEKLEAANIKLESLNLAKSNFLSLISHEIRTPLNGICGFADVLQEQLKDTEYSAYLDLLMESANRLEDFAEKALLYTELRNQDGELEMKEENIKELLENTIKKISRTSEDKIKINLSSNVEAPLFKCNYDLLEVAAYNILDNSFSFSSTQCDVHIEMSDSSCELSFIDDGEGFNENILNNGFTLLESNHADDKTSMGLSVVEQITDLHQGALSYGNNKGKGAYIRFTLPID